MTEHHPAHAPTRAQPEHLATLHWEDDDGERVLVDRYGRQLEQVRSEAAYAQQIAHELEAIRDRLALLTPGGVFGPRMFVRLDTSIETVLRVADRDNEIATAFEVKLSDS